MHFYCFEEFVLKKRKEIVFLFALIILALLLLFLGKIRVDSKTSNSSDGNLSLFCDFESVNKDGSINTSDDDFLISDVLLSQDVSFSGKNSLFIPDTIKFGNVLTFTNIKGQKFVNVEYKKKIGSDAILIFQGNDIKKLYEFSVTQSDIIEDGWYTIKMKFATSRSFNDTIKVYFWNQGKQNTYIDDISIDVASESFYPEFKQMEPLLIYISEPQLKKLNKQRDEALSKGILVSTDDSFVDALVYGDNKMMEAEVRLKGDWLDHLTGAKWSFRIKLKYDSWKGMRVFSIQTPYARGFTNEWLIHQMFTENDVMATRYGFVPVYLNGSSLGLYAYEEHFQKELIEFNKRREGPIIKFSETDFWEFVLVGAPNEIAYETSVIEPFSENKIMTDSVQYRYFILGANLLDMFREMKAPASEIFDIEKTAKFFALLDSKKAYHALRWHNLRFYYNPVLCRLEPIAFDSYSGPSDCGSPAEISIIRIGETLLKEKNSFDYLGADSAFVNSYLKYLKTFTSKKTYQYYSKLYTKDLTKFNTMLSVEFFPYAPDTSQFSKHEMGLIPIIGQFEELKNNNDYLEQIKKLPFLPFDTNELFKKHLFAGKYLKVYKNSESQLLMKIFFTDKIIVKGLGDESGITKELNQVVLPSSNELVYTKEISLSENTEEFSRLYFTITGRDTLFSSPIYPWPLPTTFNPRNDMAANASDISKYTNEDLKTITFSGNLSFSNNVYIPAGYQVVFNAGTKINLTNKAAFVSCSVVKMIGTKVAPITIYSSDKTANGFTVLQSPTKSILDYVVFRDLNTLNYKGWLLTGAVNFYESDVEIRNTLFTDNHCEDMLNTIRCIFYVHHCTMQNTFGDSYDSDFCTGTVDNCSFTNNGNDAIDFSTSDVIIKNTVINGCVDKGISVGENTKADISNVQISNVNIGVAGKDLSQVKINNLSITKAVYGFVLLQKKPEYGPSNVIAENVSMSEIGTSTLVERGSVLTLNGKVYKGTKPKLYALFYE